MDGGLVSTLGLDEGSVGARFGIPDMAGGAEGCIEAGQADSVSDDAIGTNEAVSEVLRGVVSVAPSVCCSVVATFPGA